MLPRTQQIAVGTEARRDLPTLSPAREGNQARRIFCNTQRWSVWLRADQRNDSIPDCPQPSLSVCVESLHKLPVESCEGDFSRLPSFLNDTYQRLRLACDVASQAFRAANLGPLRGDFGFDRDLDLVDFLQSQGVSDTVLFLRLSDRRTLRPMGECQKTISRQLEGELVSACSASSNRTTHLTSFLYLAKSASSLPSASWTAATAASQGALAPGAGKMSSG